MTKRIQVTRIFNFLLTLEKHDSKERTFLFLILKPCHQISLPIQVFEKKLWNLLDKEGLRLITAAYITNTAFVFRNVLIRWKIQSG